MGTYIVGGIFVLIVGVALYKTIKQAKKGGCSGCSGCSGSSSCGK